MSFQEEIKQKLGDHEVAEVNNITIIKTLLLFRYKN